MTATSNLGLRDERTLIQKEYAAARRTTLTAKTMWRRVQAGEKRQPIVQQEGTQDDDERHEGHGLTDCVPMHQVGGGNSPTANRNSPGSPSLSPNRAARGGSGTCRHPP